MNLDSKIFTSAESIERGVVAARVAITREMQSISVLESRLIPELDLVLPILLACHGKIVITGLGKSGHIGRKIAATFSSTGSSSFFVHPTEALHGDSGVLHDLDVLLAISYSGETQEVCAFSNLVKSWNIPIVALTGNRSSTLALMANAHIDISVEKEADPLSIAPTSSTTVTLVVGDVLASALMAAKNFSLEDFALRHPGGALGAQLLEISKKESL